MRVSDVELSPTDFQTLCQSADVVVCLSDDGYGGAAEVQDITTAPDLNELQGIMWDAERRFLGATALKGGVAHSLWPTPVSTEYATLLGRLCGAYLRERIAARQSLTFNSEAERMVC